MFNIRDFIGGEKRIAKVLCLPISQQFQYLYCDCFDLAVRRFGSSQSSAWSLKPLILLVDWSTRSACGLRHFYGSTFNKSMRERKLDIQCPVLLVWWWWWWRWWFNNDLGAESRKWWALAGIQNSLNSIVACFSKFDSSKRPSDCHGGGSLRVSSIYPFF